MIESIKAVGQRPPVRMAPDVFATDGTSGQTEETASAKPSLWVTHGKKNHAAALVEKATSKAQKLDEILCHDEPVVSGKVFRDENNVPDLA